MDHVIREAQKKSLKKDVPTFKVGDIVRVDYLIREGKNERVQPFIGQVLTHQGDGVSRTFTVRRIVQGEGVERTFPLHSPLVVNVTVERGPIKRPRRAKLFYLRDRSGRSAQL
jgi:large subunit ribosomal protein L19